MATKYLKGRGITDQFVLVRDPFERFGDLEGYKADFHQCIKCFGCKSVNGIWSPACPSSEYGWFATRTGGGKMLLLEGITKGELELTKDVAETFYQCTLCGNCQEQCKVPLHHWGMTDYFEALREYAVEKGVGPMPIHSEIAESIEETHNPYNESHADRLKWMPSNEKLPEKADIVYFVGCTTSYRQKRIANSTFEILKSAGADFTIMPDEWCCGDPLQRTGQRKRAEKCAEHNVEEIKKTGAKTVVTSCAGCYLMLREDYPERYGLKGDFEVVHAPDLILDLIDEGKLQLTKDVDKKVTYHDPCHLGRYSGVYESPRELLKMIPGLELVEMERNRENAWCCGAGGGVKEAFPDMALFAAKEREKEAETTGADAIATSCPYCVRNLREGINKSRSQLEMFDILELVKMAI